jgi:hypothetical protein
VNTQAVLPLYTEFREVEFSQARQLSKEKMPHSMKKQSGELAKKSDPRIDHSGRFPGLALASALRSRSQAESYELLSM